MSTSPVNPGPLARMHIDIATSALSPSMRMPCLRAPCDGQPCTTAPPCHLRPLWHLTCPARPTLPVRLSGPALSAHTASASAAAARAHLVPWHPEDGGHAPQRHPGARIIPLHHGLPALGLAAHQLLRLVLGCLHAHWRRKEGCRYAHCNAAQHCDAPLPRRFQMRASRPAEVVG